MKKGFIYILLTAVLFVTLEPVSKLIASEMNPFAITGVRFLIGGVLLLPFSVVSVRKKQLSLGLRDFSLMLLLGILCICISMPLLQYAVSVADNPSLIAVIFSANSVTTLLLSVPLLHEKLTLPRILAVILCSVGVVVCALPISATNLLSALLAIGAAATFSLYTVLSRKYAKKVSGVIQTGISFFSGSIVLLIALLCFGIRLLPVKTTVPKIGILLYLGIFVTGIAYWSYFRAMEKASVLGASFVFFIKPVLTPFATWIINGIQPGITVFAALVLVVAGSVLASVPAEKLPFLRQKSKEE